MNSRRITLTSDKATAQIGSHLAPARNYATEANLTKAIEAAGFSSLRHMVCKTVEGRWTAVFIGSDCNAVIFAGFAWIA